MNLLLVWHAGGVESYHKRIEELSRKFNVLMIVPERWVEGGKEVIANNLVFSENCKIVTCKTFVNNHGATYFYKMSIKKILRDFNPEVIHIHEEPWSLSTLQLIILNKLLKINAKVVIDSAAINLNKKPIFNLIELFNYKNSDLTFARNYESKDVLIKRGCSTPIYLLPNGVDTTLFRIIDNKELKSQQLSLDLNSTDYVIGFFGRMIKEKGIYDFVNAAKVLISNVHHVHLKFLMIGNGEEKSSVIQHVEDLNLQNHFVFLDKIDSQEVPKYMNLLDLLILPSRSTPNWKEQFGRVLVEAMACGKPVIGSKTGGIPEVIKDDRFMYDEGNVSALVNCIQYVLQNNDVINELVNNNLTRVKNEYCWESLAGYYKDILIESKVI